MKLLLTTFAIICAIFVFSGKAAAQNPIQLSLFPPVQIVPEGEPVSVFRLSLLYGKNTDMTGFDWGLVTKSTGSVKGVQWGLVGLVDQNFSGWQANLISITGGSMTGVQMGAYTSANYCNGLQFGIVNSTETIKGIQLGLINLIKTGGFMPIFPIVNWGGL